MSVEELRKWLKSSGIPKHWYCLEGGLPNEAMCIDREDDGRWSVYYSERGRRSSLRLFDTEYDACEHFRKEVVKY